MMKRVKWSSKLELNLVVTEVQRFLPVLLKEKTRLSYLIHKLLESDHPDHSPPFPSSKKNESYQSRQFCKTTVVRHKFLHRHRRRLTSMTSKKT